MPRYLLSVHIPTTGSPPSPPSESEMHAQMARIEALEGRMRSADALVSSVRLADASATKVVDATNRNGSAPVVTDGPYLEAKELIGGFYVIEADSTDAALAWATDTSRAVGMPIEVRPFMDHHDG
jgi:hypothetical protein